MSSDNPVDYKAVLEDLKANRDKIDAAIAGIETMLGIRGLSGEAPRQANADRAIDIGPGAFLGMTIVDATKKLLRAKRQNQRTEDILAALREGGLAFQSANPINTVGSVLNREYASKGEIVRVSRGVWGLAEWHPRLRKRTVFEPKNGNESTESPAQENPIGDSGEAGEGAL